MICTSTPKLEYISCILHAQEDFLLLIDCNCDPITNVVVNHKEIIFKTSRYMLPSYASLVPHDLVTELNIRSVKFTFSSINFIFNF